MVYIVSRIMKLYIRTLFGIQFFIVKAHMTCRSVSKGGYTIGFIPVKIYTPRFALHFSI